MKNKAMAIRSVATLFCICLTVGLALSVVNHFTSPIIENNQNAKENEALLVVMPDGSTFESVDISALGDTTVTAAYREGTGLGFIFRMETTGYQPNLTVLCGIQSDGTITGVQTLLCNETPGYGAQASEEWYTSQYQGKGSDLSGVQDISGATVTSKAYRRAIEDAFSAFAYLSGTTLVLSDEQLASNAVPTGNGPVPSELSTLPEGVMQVYAFENRAGFALFIQHEKGTWVLGVDPAMQELGHVIKDGALSEEDILSQKEALLPTLKALHISLLSPTLDAAVGQGNDYQAIKADFSETALTKTVSTQYSGEHEIWAKTVSAFSYNNGYLYLVQGKGYREGLYLLCAITQDGLIASTAVYAQNETAGLGDRITQDDFQAQFQDLTLDQTENIDLISGATVSSEAFRLCVQSAYAAHALLVGGVQ